MKKAHLTLFAVLAAVLLLASFTAVSAGANGPGAIACDLDITFQDWGGGDYYWKGRVDGCEVAGEISFRAVLEEYSCPPGNTLHFVETFLLEPDSGGTIEGKNWGVWNMHSGKFRAHGWVTSSDVHGVSVGNQYHEMGTTSTTDLMAEVIYAPGSSMKLTPGNRAPDSLPSKTPQHPCEP